MKKKSEKWPFEIQYEERNSLFHHRRKAHTILIISSCLVDSVITREYYSSDRMIGQTSDLYKYKSDHGTIWRGVLSKVNSVVPVHTGSTMHCLARSQEANIFRL